jgi:inactivated superfamily I helicase
MPGSRSADMDKPQILLEVRSSAEPGDLGPRLAVPEDFRARAGEIAESLAEIIEDFRSKLAHVLARRDEQAWRVGSVEIAFEIAVQAEAGVVIAKTTAGATFSARLVLQPPGEKKE